MKQLLLLLTIITVLAACKNNSEPIEKTGEVQLLPSVAAYSNDTNSDTSSIQAPKPTAAKTDNRPVKVIYVTKETVHVVKEPAVPVVQDPVPVATPLPGENKEPENTGVTTSQQSAGEINTGETGTTTPQPEKKKGWSNAAKGAVIGAGAGAVGGAIISKKKGLGAVVGGVVGAAGGYIIGKNIDKKNAGK